MLLQKIIRETKKFTAGALVASMLFVQCTEVIAQGTSDQRAVPADVSASAAEDMDETVAASEDVNENAAAEEDMAEAGADGAASEEALTAESIVEDPDVCLDEVPVGDDDDSNLEDGDKEVELAYDAAALRDALSGIECNTDVFWATPVISHDKSAVRLSWKVQGGKFYTVDSFRVDGSYEALETRCTGKTLLHENAFDSINNIHIYRLKAFDALGSQVGEYVTIPTASILAAATGTYFDTVDIGFVKIGHYYSYTIERSGKKNFETFSDSFDVCADDEPDAIKSSIESLDRVPTLRMQGFDALKTTDNSAGLSASKHNYYRVISHLVVPGLDIQGKPTAAVNVKNNKYPAPTITKVGRYYSGQEEDVTDHDLCYKNGNIYVRVDWNFLAEVETDEAEFVVYRSGFNGKYKKITSEIVGDLSKVSSLDGTKKDIYVIPYDSFPPETTYNYRVAISYKGVGAMSMPYEATCHFDDIEIISAGEHAFDEVKLKWKSDPCALKYNIYRSDDTWDEKADAELAMGNMDKDRFVKIGTKKNDTPREGMELEFTDKKKLEVGMYHIYKIVPVNKKEADFDTCCAPMALKAYPASPEEVFVYPVNLHSMDIVWSNADDAVIYKIQRTDRMYGGVPVFADEKGVEFKEWEYKATGKNGISKVTESTGITDDFGEEVNGYNFINVERDTTDTGVELGKSYYYRVVAACKVKGGAVMWADEDSANWTEAHLQLAGVRDMGTTLYGSKSTTDGSNVAQVYFKSSGENKKTSVDNIFDYRRVDHYEIAYATSEKGLDSNNPLTIDGSIFTYSTTSGTTSINILEKPDTVMFKNYRGIKRGKAYYFGVRTVYKDGDMTINGNWKKKKFILPVEVFVYPESSNRNATNSIKTRYEIPSGETRTFVIDFDPYDTTVTDVTVTLTATQGSGFTKTDIEEKNGKFTFKVTAPTTYTSSTTTTTIPQTTITVTAKNVGATGDVKEQLVKYYYIKSAKATTSSTTK